MGRKYSNFPLAEIPQRASQVKNLPVYAGDAGDMGSILGSGRSPGEENGNPLQYSCLENSMDRGGWRATVHGITKSLTQRSEHSWMQDIPQKEMIHLLTLWVFLIGQMEAQT